MMNKKTIKNRLCILFVFVFGLSSIYSEQNKIVGFDIGLTTGFPIYGDSDLNDINSRLNEYPGSRVIAGALVDLTFSLNDYLRLLFGSDYMWDFNWCDDEYFNHMDLDFFGGIKIYPMDNGFNFSVSYTFGRRTDFYKLEEKIDDNNYVIQKDFSNSSWGNGFRITLEYDFLKGSDRKMMPSVGAMYRWLPRGDNNYDNVLQLYATLSF